jgi:hypothetical protein
MPTLAIEEPVAEPKKKRSLLEIGLTAFMVLIVLALLGIVASSAFNWLAPSFH